MCGDEGAMAGVVWAANEPGVVVHAKQQHLPAELFIQMPLSRCIHYR